MKKLIIYTVVLVSIPFFIVIIFNKDKKDEIKEIKLKYMSNINIRVKRVNKDIIENVSLENYIEGVVAGEMPALFEIEALKAQAVASRSYALNKMIENVDNEYDVVDTTMNQVYLDEEQLKNKWSENYLEYINRIRQAINETSMEYLEYDNSPINAMFFSTSNGYTEDAQTVFKEDVPYLKSVDSFWDEQVSQSFIYETKIKLVEFYKILNLNYNNNLNIKILEKSKSNRITKLKINNTEFTGKEIYQKLKLRSTDFTISKIEDEVIITTKGYGHGVGMSQYGAQGMAVNGYSYKDILSHYYTNTHLKKIND